MKYITIIIIAITLFSCKKEINIDVPDSERKIVLNAIVQQDSFFTANIFRSNHIQDDISKLLYYNNAKVDVLDNGSLIETLTLDSVGHYSSKTAKAVVGHEYEFSVSVPQLKKASGKTKLLPVIPIISIDSIGTTTEEYYYGGDSPIYTLYGIKFKDTPGQKDYYRIKLNLPAYKDTTIDYYTGDTIINNNHYSIGNYTNDPSIVVWDWIDDYYYFSDILFNGKEYVFQYAILFDGNKLPNDITKQDFSISLEHITYDFFKYMQGVDMQDDADGMQLFYQATPVLNNVTDGFGMVGAASVSKKPLSE